MLSRLAPGFLIMAALAGLAFGTSKSEVRTSDFAPREVRSAVPVGDVPDVLGAAADVTAAVAAFVEEQRLIAEYLEAMRPKITVDWARWERLHVCEQSNTWYANGTNPADGARQVFQGGLGMSTGAWQMAVGAAAARGVTLPASALAATPEEQMTGAQAFYDAHGWGWACKV